LLWIHTNVLFEKFVYKLLKRFGNDIYDVHFQRQADFWSSKKIRADILLEYKKKDRKQIIDTKWKLSDKNTTADNDLKQMMFTTDTTVQKKQYFYIHILKMAIQNRLTVIIVRVKLILMTKIFDAR
jgi:hypothetical protein